ncbi:MAG: hypothetical protein HQK84_12765 [Nitrospinae bacterium]|nr:hypothetical protein [Nitrospinota bacterium]
MNYFLNRTVKNIKDIQSAEQDKLLYEIVEKRWSEIESKKIKPVQWEEIKEAIKKQR